ncbi:hypothetical protein M8C21_031913, partial [Ambrosia artemisiifolia]
MVEDGNNMVTLLFIELGIKDDPTWRSTGKRVFDSENLAYLMSINLVQAPGKYHQALLSIYNHLNPRLEDQSNLLGDCRLSRKMLLHTLSSRSLNRL